MRGVGWRKRDREVDVDERGREVDVDERGRMEKERENDG